MAQRENSRAAMERRIIDAALTGQEIKCLWQWATHTDMGGHLWDVWLWLNDDHTPTFQARGVPPITLFDQRATSGWATQMAIEPKLARLIVRKMWKQRWHPPRD